MEDTMRSQTLANRRAHLNPTSWSATTAELILREMGHHHVLHYGERHHSRVAEKTPLDARWPGASLRASTRAVQASCLLPVIGGRIAASQADQRGSDSSAVFGIGFRAVGDVALLDVDCRSADRASCVVEQHLALGRIHLPEQVARLLIVVVVDAMVPMRGGALDLELRFVEVGLVGPLAPAVREVGRRPAEIAVGAHCAVAVIAMERALWRVDRDMVEI